MRWTKRPQDEAEVRADIADEIVEDDEYGEAELKEMEVNPDDPEFNEEAMDEHFRRQVDEAAWMNRHPLY